MCSHMLSLCSFNPRPAGGRMSPVHHIPQGYNAITPYLVVKGAAQAIDYYKSVFGATELFRMPDPSGRIGHAELVIGDSHIMLADEFPEMNYRAPVADGSSPVSLLLYVEDVDAIVERAVAAGGESPKPLADPGCGGCSRVVSR